MATLSTNLILWDYCSIGVYFLLNIAVGVYALCGHNRSTVSGYFLAGRHMWWLPSIILLQLMSWVFLPVFISSGVCTVPEYMNKRFGGQRIQVYLALLSLVLYIFTKISVDLYSGALFINQVFHWNIYGSIVALLLLTAVFTITGGLAAVIYTDTLQFFIMIAGALVVMSKAFYEVGGYEALQYKYMQAVPELRFQNTSCGIPRADSWVMLRDPVNSDLPWPAFLLGQTPASIWYWCADQMMIQRTLASKNLSHAKGATLFAAYAKILPFFIIILPGMISRTLFPDDVACVLPEECMRACGSRSSCYNSAYPRLVVGIMPAGLKGIILAVMLSALMTDLTSIFNSASTMFSLDLWRRVRPEAKTRELLIVGKLCIVGLVVVSVAWVPVIEEVQSGQLFIYIQKVGAYLSPPIACVYSMAILWKRMNERGAFCGLMVGLAIGVTRMVLDFSYPPPACWQDESRPFIVRLNFMYFAVLLFWMTAITSATVSLMTQPPDSFRVIRTTFWTRFENAERDDDRRRNMEPEDYIRLNKELEDDIRWNMELEDDIPHLERGDKEAATEADGSQRLAHTTKFFLWLCGLQTQQSDPQMEESTLNSLEERPRTKLFLNINLVLVLAVGVGCFVYYSLDPFSGNSEPRLKMPT
ncbi:sodium/mannose cotransporter SLC5A10 isoform X2 [Procambarus clarkii]|uniref:sodium/mannose cotransporter SLC5A10 isoform X2 n=1 Tax=Procambarus clarkii TaxID=6728 RepID=UPI0037420B51